MLRKNRVSMRTSSSGRVQYSKTLVKEKDEEEIERDKAEYTTEDHLVELSDLLSKLRTNRKGGLTIDEADHRLKKYGPNCLVPTAALSKWVVFFNNFFGGFSSLLWMGSIMCFIGYGVGLTFDPGVSEDKLHMGIVLLIVVFITGGFGYIQEVQGIKVIQGFAKIAPNQATVIREGNEIVLPAEELVLGDIVKFNMGNIVPADVRIIEAQDLAVENSSLTGESRPVGKSPDFTDANPMETENLAFFGTFVVQGFGKGVVIATGNHTAMGRIATLTTGIESQETEIKKDLKKFVHTITIIAFVIGIAMGITGTDVAKEAADMILMDDNFASIVTGIEEGRLIFDNLKKSIAFLLTSNIPECVPFVLFVTFGIPQALSVIAIIAIDVGTDLWPSIALAYEKAGADIMLRKPRNYMEDKLVTWRLILYAYLQIGLIQTFATMACFFITMSMHGWHIRHLFGIRSQWENKVVNDLQDSYGVEWTYEERMALQRKGFAVSYLTMVVTQVADLIVCKTRRLSILQQGMSNWCINLSIVFVFIMAGLFVYIPSIKYILQFEYVEWYLVMPSVPFGLLIIIFDELRKKLIRAKPGGWADRELYY